jgi:hypothetical protein
MFAKAEWVDVTVLDLAVLNSDGTCRLDMNKLPPIPDICTSGWKSRLENLIHRFSDDRGRLDKIQKHVSRIKNEETRDLIWQASIAPQAYSKGIFDFGFKRVGRYRQPGAERLLKCFTNYLSRDADQVDFADGT